MQNHHILITGGSGLIGKQLTLALLKQGYQVSHLSREQGKNPQVKTYLWDVSKGQIDAACIDEANIIVHLAGASVAGKRWTKKRKQQIIDSRTQSIGLIYNLLRSRPHHVKQVISASATGYYGNRGDEILTENSNPGNDFLAKCCIDWEKAVDAGQALGLGITKLRTGVVLDKKGGALPQLATPIRFFVGAPLGSGKQWMPWIHHDDAVNMYMEAISGKLPAGTYNMVAPNPVTNQQMTQAVAKQLRKPLWAPKIPAGVMRLLMGEMSVVVLASDRVSSGKAEQAGFKFSYNNLEEALRNIYG